MSPSVRGTTRTTARHDSLAATGTLAAAVTAVGFLAQPRPAVLVASAVLGLAVVGAVARSTVRRRDEPYGCADRITVVRSVLVAVSAALLPVGLVPLPGEGPGPPADTWCWALFALALPAWLLDGLDGRVARRTGTATRAGARFDQEVDAGLILVLSVAVAARLGLPEAWWVLLIGAMRYLYLLGGRVRPSWHRALPSSGYRRVVAGIQGGVLLGALVPLVPYSLATAATAVALLLLLHSFGGDVVQQERAARRVS